MDHHVFAASPCGRVVRTKTGYDAYVPNPLPPTIQCNNATARALEDAGLTIGALDACLRDCYKRHLSLLLRADAVGAVRSEGWSVDIAELLRDEARGTFDEKGSRLAENYVVACEHGRTRLEELPVSLRLARELHYLLLSSGGDPRTTPGQFRRTQNWLGPPGCTLASADFVPPPAGEMRELLHNWEHYLHTRDETPSLIQLAIAHYQFMVIHPFLAMNGATIGLLSPLLLQHLGLASLPLPLVGRFMDMHATSMQQRMLGVCVTGRWEDWIAWYLHVIADAARDALRSARRLQELHNASHGQIRSSQAGEEATNVLDCLLQRGAVTPESVAVATGIAPGKAVAVLRKLNSPGIGNVQEEDDGVFWSPDIVAAVSRPVLPY